MEKEDSKQSIIESENHISKQDFCGSESRSQDVFRELAELKEKKEKDKEQSLSAQKDIFLIITRDADIFNTSLPVGKFVTDISSVVSELHIIYIGEKWQSSKKINENTFIYTVKNIPFFNFFTVYKVILTQLIWKSHFLPTVIISIGDEITISKRFSKKYMRPLYVFYSYMKVLGKEKISINALMKACPDKIFVPNEYINKAIENHSDYNPTKTKIKIFAEYVDISELEYIFNKGNTAEEVDLRNKIFTMIVFSHQVNIRCFLMIKKISEEISSSISKFQFTLVVKPSQFLQAKILGFFFNPRVIIYKESKDSINLFHSSRMMLYFDNPKVFYEPIFYSFISGCPVLSTGDEYSKIILFNSDLEEFSHLERNGKIFGLTVKRLINDSYLYSKYKISCKELAKIAFSNDSSKYISNLRDCLTK